MVSFNHLQRKIVPGLRGRSRRGASANGISRGLTFFANAYLITMFLHLCFTHSGSPV